MDLRYTILCLLVLVPFIVSHPTKTHSSCSNQQCKEPVNVVYKIGKTYEYSYETETTTSVNDAKTQLDWSGIVSITRLNQCEYQLKLKNVKVSKIQDHSKYVKTLEAHPLRFEMNDGNVTHVCASVDEPEWALNYKKAVLSMLQITPENIGGVRTVNDRDILGECETTYDVVSKSYRLGTVISKSKNLRKCRHRYTSILYPLSYELFDSWPTINCAQTLSLEGVVTSSHCEEVFHMDGKDLGLDRIVDHRVRTKLTHVKTHDNAEAKQDLPTYRKDSLLYRDDTPKKLTETELKETVTILCEEIEDEIQRSSIETLNKLSRQIGRVDYATLKKVWHAATTDQTVCRTDRIHRILMEAIQSSPSAAAFELMHNDLLPQGQVTNKDMEEYLMMLIYKSSHPCDEMLQALIKYVKSGKVPVKALFGITAVAQKYSELNEHDNHKILEEFVATYLDHMSKTGGNDKVYYLRALSNFRNLDDKAQSKLVNMYDNGKQDERAAILDTLRRSGVCETGVRNKLWSIIVSNKERVDNRILAYKAWSDCATVEEIENKLYPWMLTHKSTNDRNPTYDENSSVVNYMYHHLKNAKKTDNLNQHQLKESIFRTNFKNIEFAMQSLPKHRLSTQVDRTFKMKKLKFVTQMDKVMPNPTASPTMFILNVSLPYGDVNYDVLELGFMHEGYENIIGEANDRFTKVFHNEILPKIQRQGKSKIIQTLRDEVTTLFQEFKQPKSDAHAQGYVSVGGVMICYHDTRHKENAEPISIVNVMKKSSPAGLIYESGHALLFGSLLVPISQSNGMVVVHDIRLSGISGVRIGRLLPPTDAKDNRFGAYLNDLIELHRSVSVQFGGACAEKAEFAEKLRAYTNFSMLFSYKKTGTSKDYEQEFQVKLGSPKMDILALEQHFQYRDFNEKHLKDMPHKEVQVPRRACNLIPQANARMCISQNYMKDHRQILVQLERPNPNSRGLFLKRKVSEKNGEIQEMYDVELPQSEKLKFTTTVTRKVQQKWSDFKHHVQLDMLDKMIQLESLVVASDSKMTASLSHKRKQQVNNLLSINVNGKLHENGKTSAVIKYVGINGEREYTINVLKRADGDERVYGFDTIDVKSNLKLLKGEISSAGLFLPNAAGTKDLKLKVDLQAFNPSQPRYAIINAAITKKDHVTFDAQSEIKLDHHDKPVKSVLKGTLKGSDNGGHREINGQVEYQCSAHPDHSFNAKLKHKYKFDESCENDLLIEMPKTSKKLKMTWNSKFNNVKRDSRGHISQMKANHKLIMAVNSNPEQKLDVNFEMNREPLSKYTMSFHYDGASPNKQLKGSYSRQTLSKWPSPEYKTLLNVNNMKDYDFMYKHDMSTLSQGRYKSEVTIGYGRDGAHRVTSTVLITRVPEEKSVKLEVRDEKSSKLVDAHWILLKKNNRPVKVDIRVAGQYIVPLEFIADVEQGMIVLSSKTLNFSAYKHNGTISVEYKRHPTYLNTLFQAKAGLLRFQLKIDKQSKKQLDVELHLDGVKKLYNVLVHLPTKGEKYQFELGNKKLLAEIATNLIAQHGTEFKTEISGQDGFKLDSHLKNSGKIIGAAGMGMTRDLNHKTLRIQWLDIFKVLIDLKRLNKGSNETVDIEFHTILRNQQPIDFIVKSDELEDGVKYRHTSEILYKRGNVRLIKSNINIDDDKGSVNQLMKWNDKLVFATSGKWSKEQPLILDIETAAFKAILKKPKTKAGTEFEFEAHDHSKSNKLKAKVSWENDLAKYKYAYQFGLETARYGQFEYRSEKDCKNYYSATYECDMKRGIDLALPSGYKMKADGKGHATMKRHFIFRSVPIALKGEGSVSFFQGNQQLGTLKVTKEFKGGESDTKECSATYKFESPNSAYNGLEWDLKMKSSKTQTTVEGVRKHNGKKTGNFELVRKVSDGYQYELNGNIDDVRGEFKVNVKPKQRQLTVRGHVNKGSQKFANVEIDFPKVKVADFHPTNGHVVLESPIVPLKIVYNSPSTKKAELTADIGSYHYLLHVGEEKRQRTKRDIHPLLVTTSLKKAGSNIFLGNLYLDNDWSMVDFESVPIVLRAKIDQTVPNTRKINSTLCLNRRGCFSVDTIKLKNADQYELNAYFKHEDLRKQSHTGELSVACVHKLDHRRQRFIVGLNDAKIGFDYERKQQDSNTHVNTQMYLLKRVIRLNREKSPTKCHTQFWLNAERQPNEVLTIKGTINGDKRNYEITHPSLSRPVKIDATQKLTSEGLESHAEINFSDDIKSNIILDANVIVKKSRKSRVVI